LLTSPRAFAPRRQGAGAVFPEVSLCEVVAFQIEEGVDRGTDRGESVQASHLPEPKHRSFAPS
jgi:hypothetical protein